MRLFHRLLRFQMFRRRQRCSPVLISALSPAASKWNSRLERHYLRPVSLNSHSVDSLCAPKVHSLNSRWLPASGTMVPPLDRSVSRLSRVCLLRPVRRANYCCVAVQRALGQRTSLTLVFGTSLSDRRLISKMCFLSSQVWLRFGTHNLLPQRRVHLRTTRFSGRFSADKRKHN